MDLGKYTHGFMRSHDYKPSLCQIRIAIGGIGVSSDEIETFYDYVFVLHKDPQIVFEFIHPNHYSKLLCYAFNTAKWKIVKCLLFSLVITDRAQCVRFVRCCIYGKAPIEILNSVAHGLNNDVEGLDDIPIRQLLIYFITVKHYGLFKLFLRSRGRGDVKFLSNVLYLLMLNKIDGEFIRIAHSLIDRKDVILKDKTPSLIYIPSTIENICILINEFHYSLDSINGVSPLHGYILSCPSSPPPLIEIEYILSRTMITKECNYIFDLLSIRASLDVIKLFIKYGAHLPEYILFHAIRFHTGVDVLTYLLGLFTKEERNQIWNDKNILYVAIDCKRSSKIVSLIIDYGVNANLSHYHIVWYAANNGASIDVLKTLFKRYLSDPVKVIAGALINGCVTKELINLMFEMYDVIQKDRNMLIGLACKHLIRDPDALLALISNRGNCDLIYHCFEAIDNGCNSLCLSLLSCEVDNINCLRNNETIFTHLCKESIVGQDTMFWMLKSGARCDKSVYKKLLPGEHDLLCGIQAMLILIYDASRLVPESKFPRVLIHCLKDYLY